MLECYSFSIKITGETMLKEQIIQHFSPVDDWEEKQRQTGRFIEEFAEERELGQPRFKIQNHLFHENHPIVIRKHRRFAPYPLHSHHFLEFNYMLQGTSKQVVNGKEITLKENQLLLLDTDSQHELAALGEADLLLNFLFRTKDLKLSSLKRTDAESAGMTYDFIMNAILGPNYHENYLILDLTKEVEARMTLEQMISESINARRLGQEITESLSQVLFLQLSRIYQSQVAAIYKDATQDDVMVKILQRIEESSATLTLNQLAKDIGYNRNYLSNLIKKRTQSAFKELVTKERLKNAQQLLIATTLPIEEISQYTGFSSKTQFYKKFREQYGQTPKELRDQAQ